MQATGRGSAERERHKGFLLVLGLIVRLCSKYTSFFSVTMKYFFVSHCPKMRGRVGGSCSDFLRTYAGASPWPKRSPSLPEVASPRVIP